MARTQGAWTALELHTLGWKAFQDLCVQVCEEVLRIPSSIYRDAQDGGQDAVFMIKSNKPGSASDGTVQCKFTSISHQRLKASDLEKEFGKIDSLVKKNQADTYILMTNLGIDAPVAIKIKERLKSIGVKNRIL